MPLQRWKRLLRTFSEEIKLKQSQRPLTVKRVLEVWLGNWVSKEVASDDAYREAVELAKKNPHDAEGILTDMVFWRTETLGPENPHTMLSMSGLALLYMQQERFTESTKVRQELIKSDTKLLGQEHPTTLTETVNMPWAYWCEHDLEGAESTLREFPRIVFHVFGKEKPPILQSYYYERVHILGPAPVPTSEIHERQRLLIQNKSSDNFQVPRGSRIPCGPSASKSRRR